MVRNLAKKKKKKGITDTGDTTRCANVAPKLAPINRSNGPIMRNSGDPPGLGEKKEGIGKHREGVEHNLSTLLASVYH